MREELVVLLTVLARALSTDRPVIGVLFQEPGLALQGLRPDALGYLPASYVAAVQASGARVLPIPLNRTVSYYRSLLKSLNGVVLPGGNTWFYGHPGGYADSGEIIINEAKALNENGIHFPVVGICLGMELLLWTDNGREEYRAACNASDVALSLRIKEGFERSRLFSGASSELLALLIREPITYNQHRFCVTEANLTRLGLSEDWSVLSTSTDPSAGLEFISAIESRRFPFVGLQFHPEKTPFEWKKKGIPHSYDAIRVSRYFFDWLIREARVNNQTFPSSEYDKLIYSYQTYVTLNTSLAFDEVYLDLRKSTSPPTHSPVSVLILCALCTVLCTSFRQ